MRQNVVCHGCFVLKWLVTCYLPALMNIRPRGDPWFFEQDKCQFPLLALLAMSWDAPRSHLPTDSTRYPGCLPTSALLHKCFVFASLPLYLDCTGVTCFWPKLFRAGWHSRREASAWCSSCEPVPYLAGEDITVEVISPDPHKKSQLQKTHVINLLQRVASFAPNERHLLAKWGHEAKSHGWWWMCHG